VKTPEKNWLEWTVFWSSLALVLGVVSYLVHAAATTAGTPPQLVVELGAPERVPAGYAVPVSVSNRGDRTAANVRLAVALEGSGERGELQLDFVPQRSSRKGWVTFREFPAAGRLRASILGYESP
jgi:uncharacterized protein (TIGR02588 family)